MTPPLDTILCGDSLQLLKKLPDNSVQCCVTSPPYYALRDYGMAGQIGREDTPEKYIKRLTAVFREVHRVLRLDGTCWLNIGDTYCGKGNQGEFTDPKYPNGRTGQAIALNNKVEGCKAKDLIGIPWMLAFSLRADGWYLRSDIIWMKNNPMPESVKDRPTRCYEHVFLLSKSRRYFYNWESIAEPVAASTLTVCVTVTAVLINMARIFPANGTSPSIAAVHVGMRKVKFHKSETGGMYG